VAVSSLGHSSARKLAGQIGGCRAVRDNQQVADAAGLVFIATPDDAISDVTEAINWKPEHFIVHLSGADSVDKLAATRQAGANVGVFHPLQTFADSGADKLKGINYAIEAEEPLLSILKGLAAELGGHSIELKAEDRVLYHAAAVFACNYIVTLTKLSTDLWQGFGASREEALRALLPLIKGTVQNIETAGLPDCLTGPIARGDAGTVKKHLAAMEEKAPQLVAAYRELALKTIPIALAKGRINIEQAEALEAAATEKAGLGV
jgi:predicted short-subunit dehydrogenase-like oxidoreductase (DUF2520 family)